MKRKTILKILALLAALLTVLPSCKAKDEYAAPSGMKTASADTAGYCLYVPKTWTVDYTTAATGAYYSATDPSSVSVMAWEMEHTDSTVEDWWALNVDEIKSVFSGFELVSEENAEIDGLFAKKYVYTGSLGENTFRFMQVACVKNATVYLFTYTSNEENYEKHTADVETMLACMRIK